MSWSEEFVDDSNDKNRGIVGVRVGTTQVLIMGWDETNDRIRRCLKNGSWVCANLDNIDYDWRDMNKIAAFMSNGYVILTIHHGQVKWFEFDGTNWTDKGNIAGTDASTGCATSFAISTENVVHNAHYKKTGTDKIRYVKYIHGSGWGSVETVDDSTPDALTNIRHPAICADANGIYIACLDTTNNDVYYSQKTNGSWATLKKVNSAGTKANEVKIACISGRRCIIWREGAASPYTLMYSFTTDGVNFDAPAAVFNSGKDEDMGAVWGHGEAFHFSGSWYVGPANQNKWVYRAWYDGSLKTIETLKDSLKAAYGQPGSDIFANNDTIHVVGNEDVDGTRNRTLHFWKTNPYPAAAAVILNPPHAP